ncbi:DUF1415 family protein, partial [Thiocapsa sp.]|uniref:DUF1415 family protein n=1 Tax=Thiocapsa sp. TaxID=2024551 RepID=UPI00359401DE
MRTGTEDSSVAPDVRRSTLLFIALARQRKWRNPRVKPSQTRPRPEKPFDRDYRGDNATDPRFAGDPMIESEEVIERTKRWISEIVIGCRFCPFAAKEFKRGTVHYQVEGASDPESCLQAFMMECHRLDANSSIETTLLILPEACLDFDDYLDLVAMAEALLEAEGYEGVYQVAGFHP